MKQSEQAMCSLSASTPSWLIEAIEADSACSSGAQSKTRHGGSAASHAEPSRLIFFSVCVFVCVSKMRACCQPHCTSSLSDTHQGGGRPGLTLCDKSFSHSQSHCLRGSPSPSIPHPTLSFIHASVGLCPPTLPPPASTRSPPLPHSPPLHFICILFLGPLISPPSRPFLISLYRPPSSCSSFSETMLL